jgi:hypothetical protein
MYQVSIILVPRPVFDVVVRVNDANSQPLVASASSPMPKMKMKKLPIRGPSFNVTSE